VRHMWLRYARTVEIEPDTSKASINSAKRNIFAKYAVKHSPQMIG